MKIYTFLGVLLAAVACKNPIIDGYTDKISYDSNDSIQVFINAIKEYHKHKSIVEDINGSKVFSFEIVSIFPQDTFINQPYKNGFKYQLTHSLQLPNFKSGVYVIDDKIPFVVRPNLEEEYDFLVVYSSNTENAYSCSGGKSTYVYNSSGKVPAKVVSFQRPLNLPFHSKEFLKWIATKNKKYKIGYLSDQDLDNFELFNTSNLIIIPGHSEYWTKQARLNLDRYVNEGNHALILSGNTMWWQVRYSADGNQMICYKGSTDPVEDSSLLTITWPDAALNYSVMESIGLDFMYGGFGKKVDNGWDGYRLVNTNSQIFKDCYIEENDLISLPADEVDGAPLIFSLDSSSFKLDNPFGYFRYELFGFDFTSNNRKGIDIWENTNGAWVGLQRNETSGIIINTGNTNWCKKAGMEGDDADLIKKITLNMIDLLMEGDAENIFTGSTQRYEM